LALREPASLRQAAEGQAPHGLHGLPGLRRRGRVPRAAGGQAGEGQEARDLLSERRLRQGRPGRRQARIKGLGGAAALAGEVSYEVADREVGTHALKLKESGADTLVLYSTAPHGANVIKEMAKVGYRPKIFASFPLGDRHVMFRLLGDLWEGAYYDV